MHAIAGDDESLRHLARKIFAAGCRAADPYVAARRALAYDGKKLAIGKNVGEGLGGEPVKVVDLGRAERVLLVGVGKACVRMAEGVASVLGDRIEAGFLVTKYGHSEGHRLPGRFSVSEAAHPTTDQAGVDATVRMLEFLRGADGSTLVVCCITGGGTALLSAPQEPLTLAEYIQCNQVLLGCGCPIQDKNAVLKHLCRVKGGQLARACGPAEVVSLLVSDVVGDPFDVIASGPTAPDSSTFEQCLEILDFYRIHDQLPPAALRVLQEGRAGARPETPKADAPMFARGTIFVAASNQVAVDACVQEAESLGFNALALSSFMEGEATELAKAYAGIAKEIRRNNRPVRVPAAVVGGGETTVTLPPGGGGVGGRSQALALSAMRMIEGIHGTAILAGGTDGGDGPCDAAGAVVCGGDAAKARSFGLKVASYLRGADSYNFYVAFEDKKYGRHNVLHLRDGPTGTNVMDLVITLVV